MIKFGGNYRGSGINGPIPTTAGGMGFSSRVPMMRGFNKLGGNMRQHEGLFRSPNISRAMGQNYEGISRYAGMGMAALGGINTYSNLRDRRFGSAMFSAGMGGLGVYMTSKAGQQATARTLRSIVGQVTAKAAQFKK